jgi:hypothetical protein
MAVEVGDRWQIVCCHGVVDAAVCTRRCDCVRLVGSRANCERVRSNELVDRICCGSQGSNVRRTDLFFEVWKKEFVDCIIMEV